MHDTVPVNGPAVIFRTKVSEQWIDYNDHMTESAYSLVFGQAIDAFVTELGIGRDYRNRTGCTVYTITSQVNFVREVRRGTELEIDLRMLDLADNLIHVFQSMYDIQRQLKATYEAVIAHVKQRPHPKIAPFPSQVQVAFQALRRQHAAYDLPARAGQPVGIRR